MPRQFLLNQTMTKGTAISSYGGAATAAAAAFLLLCAFIVTACASHARQWRRLISVSRRHREPVISIHQVQPGIDGEACIWQKNILMGEKCQLPDFSGVIAYDTAGNLIAPGGPRLANSLQW